MNDLTDHDQLRSLLGAYALDATDQQETIAVEDHLRHCDECRAEIDSLREVAGLLGTDDVPPPPIVWERIAGQLGSDPPAAEPIMLTARRARPAARRLTALAVAAAVLLVVGVLSLAGLALNQQHRLQQADQKLEQVQANPAMRVAADRAAAEPGARTIALRDDSGARMASMVVTADGTGYLMPDRSLPPLDPDKTYQLWGVEGKTAVSLGVLGANPEVSRLQVPDGVEALAITAEHAPGVVSSSNQPVALGKLV